MSVDAARPWIRALRPEATHRVLCFGYAGSGAAAFRGWSEVVPAYVDVAPVVLPGRETRIREPAFTAMAPLVEAILPAILPAIRRVPWAVYGHSMGAWVAYELVRALRDRGGPLPEAMFLGARRAPHLVDPRPPLSGLGRDAFVAAVQDRYQAIPQALLDQPEVLDLFLPTLRADFALLDAYAPVEAPPLPVPLVALRGQDDATMTHADLQGWARYTSAPFTARTVPGGHFFLDEQRDLLGGMIAASLRR